MDHEDYDDSMGFDFYTSKADCWSLGVMLYMLLCGHYPFKETSSKNLTSVIKSGKFDSMTGPCWANVSPLAKDLVTKLLDINPVTRFSAEQVIGHEWFTQDREVVDKARVLMGIEVVTDDSDVRESSKEVGCEVEDV